MSNADFDPVANILAVTKSPVATPHLFNAITSDHSVYGIIVFILKHIKLKIKLLPNNFFLFRSKSR